MTIRKEQVLIQHALITKMPLTEVYEEGPAWARTPSFGARLYPLCLFCSVGLDKWRCLVFGKIVIGRLSRLDRLHNLLQMEYGASECGPLPCSTTHLIRAELNLHTIASVAHLYDV